jgi:hypothetical protein
VSLFRECWPRSAGSVGYRKQFAPTMGRSSPAGRSTRWAYAQRVDLKLISAGKLTQNPYIESFNCKFRECLERSLLQ